MTELRQFYRAPSSRKVELLHRGESHEGCLENISFNGALIHLGGTLPSLAVGTGCLLRIHLDPTPAPRSPLQIWTEVVHGGNGLIGLKFVDHDAEGSECIALLMELIREEPGQNADQLDRIRGYLCDFCGTR
jgi:PilZ domain.